MVSLNRLCLLPTIASLAEARWERSCARWIGRRRRSELLSLVACPPDDGAASSGQPISSLALVGPRYCQLYNDPYRPVLGDKHPASMGQPASECFPEIWDVIGPLIDTPFNGGSATWMDDLQLEYIATTALRRPTSPLRTVLCPMKPYQAGSAACLHGARDHRAGRRGAPGFNVT
jgi:hypothetical protein